MSAEDHTVSFSLEVNIEKAYEDIRRVQTLLYRTLGLVSRLTGNENVDLAIRHIQRLIAWLNQLRLTIAAFEATTGPIGWAMLGLTVATTAVSYADMMEGY